MAAGFGQYGTMPCGHGQPDPHPAARGVGRKLMVAVGLAVCSVAIVAVALGSFQRRDPVALLDITKMEDEMFQKPSQIYQQTLSDAIHHQNDDSAMAWAHPQWKADERKRQSALASLEKDIVAGVTKQLASRVSQQVSHDLAGMIQSRMQPGPATRKQNLMSKMQATISKDQAKLARDMQVAKFLGTGKKGASTLANSYSEPITVGEPEKQQAPFYDDVAPSVAGPSDTHSYWLGDHYHDQEGPPGVDTGLETEPAGGKEAEEGEEGAEKESEEEGAEKGEEGADEEDEAAKKFWSERDNRVKLEKEGVRVQTDWPDWVDKDLDALHDEKELNDGGVVTDALPGMGHGYKKAIPSPVYEHDPTPEEESAALEQGHRYISPQAAKMEKDLNVNLAGPAWGLYGPADKTTKMDQKQEEWPYMDGMEDNIQASHAARQHKPLSFWLHDPKRGSTKLEGKGVNVWGEPVGLTIPEDFFDSEAEDKGAVKLKKAGVQVSRLSMVPKHGPGPFD